VKRLLPLLLWATACAHAPEPLPAPEPPPPAAAVAPAIPPDEALLRRIRADVDGLLAAQGEATWTAWTTGAPLDVAAPHTGREWLSDGSALRALDALAPAGDPAERARRGMLRDFLVGEVLAASVAPAAGGAPVDLSFSFDGRTVALREVSALLAAEPDAGRRANLDAARALAALRAARIADADATALAAAAAKLGMPDVDAVAQALRGARADDLAALASATLDATGPAYCAAADQLARREVGVPLSATRMRDLPRMLRASHEPKAHPAARLVPDGQAVAAAAGVDLASRVKLDDRPAPRKSQRPLTVPVQVPGDVRLSALPSGGASEARAFLHELGVAFFLSGIRAEGVEARRLGSPAASATWGFLVEALASDPAWLHDRSGIVGHELAREIRAAQADRLHAVRMQAARLLREIDRARGGTPGAAGDAKILSRALCHPVDAQEAAHWPLQRDPLLGSADSLRAALLAAQIEAALANQGGGPWWRWSGAPAWLARMWEPGGVANADDLARAAGVAPISPGPIARTAKARFDGAGW
jgi:hypothetical protein